MTHIVLHDNPAFDKADRMTTNCNAAMSTTKKTRQQRYGTFSCDLCDRIFTRKDVVQRHKKLVHFRPPKVKISKRRACTQCMTSKLKCTGGIKCENCIKRGIDCDPGPAWRRKMEDGNIETKVEPPVDEGGEIFQPSEIGNEFPEIDTFGPLNNVDNHFGLDLESICNTDWLRYDLDNMEMMIEDVGVHSASGNNNVVCEIPTPSGSTTSSTTENNDDNWPFSYRKTPGKIQVVLPPIKWTRTEGLDADGTRQALTNLLTQPYTKNRWPREEPDRIIPGSDVLDEFINLFFTHFDQVSPIIHQYSWNKNNASLLELASIISIGAGFSDRPEAHLFADNLSELLKRTINWHVDRDRSCLRQEDFLSAMLLQSIYALGSGNKSLYEVADSSRSQLIGSARESGLFNLNFDDFGIKDWISYERRKRIAWLIFEFDCTVCTLTASRPCMSLHDLNNNLPCDEDVWECKRPWKDGLKFKQTISDILQGKDIPATNWYSRRLISQALGRSVWDYVELESNAVFRTLRMPEMPNERLLASLDRLKEIGNHTPKDPYHVSMTHMVVSYSHLYSRHVIELITSATRQPDFKKIDMVLKSLDQKAEDSRFLAWQACQIISVIRYSPIHAPCETMRLFMAGLYLYWFALSSPSSVPGATIVPLDTLPWGASFSLPNHWIQNGGPACISNKHGQFIKVTGKDGANAVIDTIVDLLKELKVWGLADRFCHILSTMKDLTPKLQVE